ncbi:MULTISPECIES: hypothetical protein [Sphingomonas]|uniref:Uncharacterized protein n=1 Tax=Sphingomonas kyungheensis TaxID=1069987 RepID=A0ABU8GYN5_9SPHN|nr:hypothetical protein [Sphingomonas sp. CV7422]
MGIKGTLAGFIDNVGLADAFNNQVEDPGKIRKPVLDGIRRAREQFASRGDDQTRVASRWWQIKNNVVAFTVKVGGEVLEINGAATNHLPVDRFAEFLTMFEQAVGEGEFDDELKDKGIGRPRPRPAPAKAGATDRVAVGQRHPSNDRADWDELTWAQRQKVSAFYRAGKNPDGTAISKVGYLPDAPLAD